MKHQFLQMQMIAFIILLPTENIIFQSEQEYQKAALVLSSKIIFNDKNLQALKKQMKSASVQVGLPKGTPTKEDYGGLTVVELGAVHEFGSPAKNIPERSFIRVPIFKSEKEFKVFAKKQGIMILEGKQTVLQGITKIGIWGQSIIMKSFTDNNWQPLKQSTVNKKGSSKPLIDIGNLRQSITYSIDK
jgi:phage gpG-like protein